MQRSDVLDLVLTTALFGAVLAVLFQPSLLPAVIYDAVPAKGDRLRTGYFGALASLLLLYIGWRILHRFRRPSGGAGGSGRANDDDDEGDGERVERSRLATMDARIAAAVDGNGEDHREEVREELRSVAVELLTRERGLAETRARTRIESGEWTDDRRASVFLGGPGAPAPSLRVRIFDWLSVEGAYTRRLDATIAELESIVEDSANAIVRGESS